MCAKCPKIVLPKRCASCRWHLSNADPLQRVRHTELVRVIGEATEEPRELRKCAAQDCQATYVL